MGDYGVFLMLAAAAFGAGVLNALAGGGTFLTLPALIAAGVPPIAANATSALAVCPGYLGSVLGFRTELTALPPVRLRREALIVSSGGVIGALLLLVTPAQVFAGLVPWLLLLATLLFAIGPWLTRWAGSEGAAHQSLVQGRAPALLAVAIYGGYFNGGLGILLLALYLLTGETHLNTANALKNFNSFVLSVVSVGVFALGGAILWRQALWMAAFAILGGFSGARLAQRLPTFWLRLVVIATGLTMTVLFFQRTG